MPDAAEQSTPGVLVRMQHFFEYVAAREVRVSDDAGDHRLAGSAFCACSCDVCNEHGFSDAAQVFGPVGSITCTTLDKNGFFDVVAGAGVGPQFFERVVADVAATPQVMVWIDDTLRRIERGFFDSSEPGGIDRLDGRHDFPSLRTLTLSAIDEHVRRVHRAFDGLQIPQLIDQRLPT